MAGLSMLKWLRVVATLVAVSLSCSWIVMPVPTIPIPMNGPWKEAGRAARS